MNTVILDAIAKSPPVVAGSAPSDAPIDADMFRQTLADKIGQAKTAITTARSATVAGGAKKPSALEAKIAKMLASGVSQAEVVATLAASLAQSVAKQLGVTSADGRAQLQAVFAEALAPPGERHGAQRSLADRTRALAERYTTLQDIANALLDPQNSGQQNRIAGIFLDALPAKETPAPSVTDPDVRLAGAGAERLITHDRIETTREPAEIAAPAAFVPAVKPERFGAAAATAERPATSPLEPASAALASLVTGNAGVRDAPRDGRTVTLGDLPALGSGGDTTLGRVLARAARVADARESGAAATNAGATGTAKAVDPKAPVDAGVAKFLRAFSAAMVTDAPPAVDGAKPTVAQQTAPLSLPIAHDAPVPPGAFMPSVVPFTIEAMPRVTPAAAAHAPDIDQSAIVDQVLRGALMRNTAQSSEMRLSLVPETLGEVSVRLVVTAGNISAHILAQTPEVRDALVAAQPQLAKTLADSGLKLQSLSVDLSGSGFGGFSQQHHDSTQNGNRARQSANANDDATDAALDAIPSFNPPILARNLAGDYNYLV